SAALDNDRLPHPGADQLEHPVDDGRTGAAERDGLLSGRIVRKTENCGAGSEVDLLGPAAGEVRPAVGGLVYAVDRAVLAEGELLLGGAVVAGPARDARRPRHPVPGPQRPAEGVRCHAV